MKVRSISCQIKRVSYDPHRTGGLTANTPNFHDTVLLIKILYIIALHDNVQLTVFYNFSVERILSPYAKKYTTLLTAADVPWPEVIEACIKTLLSWLHTLYKRVTVYYMAQDLDEFQQPPLWREAATETVKLMKGNSEMRYINKSSYMHCLPYLLCT